MTTLSTQDRNASLASVKGDRAIRDALFLATLLLAWFTMSPFPDLSDPQLLAPKTSGDPLGQAAVLLLTGALAAFALLQSSPLIRRMVTFPLALTIIAFAVSATLSAYPDVAAKHLVLAVLTIFQATMVLLLPNGREHFARLLAILAIIVLVACYVGIAFLPDRSIHQASDIAEPALAGDWRGFFTHKNGAGAGMVLLIFAGIFVCRAWNRLVGVGIIVFAGIFLFFTHSKSPINLLPVTLVLSYLLLRTRNALVALALVTAVPLLLNLLSVGSVMFGPVKNVVDVLMSDPTYTGRDDIWRFALDHVAQRPLFGFGFESFWGMPNLVAEWNYLEPWGYRASDAHNGYLNLAVTAGLIGLGLSLLWMVVQPFVDCRRAMAHGADHALTALFLQIWLFMLCLAAYESVFFAGGSAAWFMMVVSIIGLRFQTLAKSRW
jgi:O-antigen ligase